LKVQKMNGKVLCVCDECGEDFPADSNRAKICSSRCRMRRYRKTAKGQAKVLADNLEYYKRPDLAKTCGVCNTEYVTSRDTQRFCSKCSATPAAAGLVQKVYASKNAFKIKARAMICGRINSVCNGKPAGV
jgi:hypothetical protein